MKPRTEVLAFVALVLTPFAIAASLPFVSERFEHIEFPRCVPGKSVPWWDLELWRKWCEIAERKGPGPAYASTGFRAMLIRPCAAFRMLERGAELGDGESYAGMGHMLRSGSCVRADESRAIEAYEAAVRLRSPLGSSSLQDVYDKRAKRGDGDPIEAVKWAFADPLIFGISEGYARDYGRRLGLSPAQIEEARERMRRWIDVNKVPTQK